MLSAELGYAVLEAAPDAIIVIDAAGLIQFANSRVCVLFGHSRETLIGREVETLLPERFRRQHSAHRANYARTSRVRPMGSGLDLVARRSDGSEFPVEISLSPIPSGREVLVAAAIRDVTDHKQADAALRRARAEADQANQAKSRFLAMASHDLRQPLQSLALLNGSLRRLVHDDRALDALEQQSTAIETMSRLLNSLLDISKLESGAVQPHLTDFSLSALFADLLTEFREVARDRGLTLVLKANGARARSDAALVGQILRNLIGNALKYTRHGEVQVLARHEHDMICIDVHDTGIGIPPDQLNLIFDEFYQVGMEAIPDGTRDGYGLGLSIVRRLARLLDAPLSVDSTAGQGTTFTLMIPEARFVFDANSPHPPQSHPPSTSLPAADGKHHVMLVEDDPGVRNATRIFLTAEGFRVTALASLDEATAAARGAADIDVIVTDYHLGNSSTGTEVIAALRTLLHRDVKAVLVTGDTAAAIRDLHTDANLRMVRKPVNAGELAGLLRHFLVPSPPAP